MVPQLYWCEPRLCVEDRTLTYEWFTFMNCDFEGELALALKPNLPISKYMYMRY